MIRVIIAAPNWAVEGGLAEAGETQTQLCETEEEANSFASTGQLISYRQVSAENDGEMFIRMWC